jgi:phenylpyruvate tautomerase PptA (4-oxalocrotonate tautomerase family)
MLMPILICIVLTIFRGEQWVAGHQRRATRHRKVISFRIHQRGSTMPLARIDVSASLSAQAVQVIGNTVYDAMIEIAGVPEHDKFQIIHRHSADELVFPEAGYLGISHTSQMVVIQITWNSGRSVAVKKAFYRAVADGIHARTGIATSDVVINLVDVQREDWSFGNGEMQYAPV